MKGSGNETTKHTKQVAADCTDTNREIESKDLALLVRLEKKNENKLSPAYEEMPYKITTRYGDQIYIKSRFIAGVEYIGKIFSI